MLKGIPNILPPELLKILMEMGHGDEIVLADDIYPTASNAQRLIRCDGHNLLDLLDAVLQLFRLDATKQPASIMGIVLNDNYIPEIRKYLMASPEVPEAKESNGEIKIPELSAIVLMEK